MRYTKHPYTAHKGLTIMAFDFKTLTFIKASELPATGGFRTSTPKMAISENGQARFSKAVLTHDAWVDKTRLYIGWDAASRTLGIMPIGDKLPKGLTEADLFPLRSGEKHPDNKYVSLAGVLKVCGYDFRTSGQQNWDIELGAKGEFTIALPTSLPRKPKVERKKKETPAAVQAEAGKNTKLPDPNAAATNDEDDDPFGD
jgi:hypothetical protein